MAARVFLLSVVCTVGLIAGRTIGLEVGVGLSEEAEDGVGVRGRPLGLPCLPSSPANVSWSLNGRPVTPNPRIHIYPNGTLYIKKVVHKKKSHGSSDAGVYRCTVSNEYGAIVSRPANVQIAAIPHEFSSDPENTTVYEGDVVRLTCSIESIPPAIISWQRDYQPLPHNKRYVTTDSGVLYIVNVKKEESGKYRCQATNNLLNKTRTSKEALLTVENIVGTQPSNFPATAQFLPESPQPLVVIKEGQNGSLICAARGIPKPTLTWFQNKNDGTNEKLQTTSSGLNVWRILKATQENSGKYTCIASQTMKVTAIQKVTIVEVHTPPEIVKKPTSQVYLPAGTVRIECEVKGFPEPTVTWLKNAQIIYPNERIKQNVTSLKVSDVVAKDSGVYQCMAGKVWAAARIFVSTSSEQPLPPSHLTCTAISPTQVRLTWNLAKEGTIKAYTVHYFLTDQLHKGSISKPVDKGLFTKIVEKLTPYTNYTFYVRSYSDRSASEHSERVTCLTKEAVPVRGPHVTVNAVGKRSMNVSWQPLPPSDAMGVITQYKVQWKRTNQTSMNFEVLPGYINYYIISGLQSGTNYLLRVIGSTSLGWPDLPEEKAPWISAATLSQSSSSIPPPDAYLTIVNSTTILVEWTFTDEIGIEGFQLAYCKMSKGNKETINVPANITSYLISDLDKGHWYEISLRGYADKVEGELWGESLVAGEAGAALPAPLDPEAHPVSNTSIRVSWSSPPVIPITSYTVFYNPSNDSAQQSIKTNKTEILITGLKYNTVYELKVMAHGLNGLNSVNSTKLECRTLEEIGVIEDFQWKALSTSSVKIMWKSLNKKNPTMDYILFYTADASIPTHQWKQVIMRGNTIELSGLIPYTRYSLKVQAKTGSNNNVFSSLYHFNTTPDKNFVQPPSEPHKPNSNSESDQFLGILVGCAISLCCIIMCTATLVFRRRCVKYPRNSSNNSNSQHPPCTAQYEMQTLTNLDAKGSHTNERANGLKFPLIFNGIGVPNGQVRDISVHITENPQYEAYKSQEGEGSRTTDEGDSLLSGPELELEADETQVTAVDTSVAKDMVPDDGFHETVPNTILTTN